MPTRLLREGILSSERVDALDWPAEVFYRRLMSKVDDHGLYDARPSMLRASLYPLKVDRVREADISRWIAMCEKAGVIVLYSAGGKPYLKMLDTHWQVRSEAKFPIPPENIGKQLQTPVHLDVDVDVVVVEDGGTPFAPSDKSLDAADLVKGSAVAFIPVIGNAEFGVSKELLAELETAYPLVDGLATLREIRAWCITNPRKRKTKSGVTRFINTWFAKDQNRG